MRIIEEEGEFFRAWGMEREIKGQKGEGHGGSWSSADWAGLGDGPT